MFLLNGRVALCSLMLWKWLVVLQFGTVIVTWLPFNRAQTFSSGSCKLVLGNSYCWFFSRELLL